MNQFEIMHFVDHATPQQLQAMVAAKDPYSFLALAKLQDLRDQKMRSVAQAPQQPPLSASIPMQLHALERRPTSMGLGATPGASLPHPEGQQPLPDQSQAGIGQNQAPTGCVGGLVAFKEGGDLNADTEGEGDYMEHLDDANQIDPWVAKTGMTAEQIRGFSLPLYPKMDKGERYPYDPAAARKYATEHPLKEHYADGGNVEDYTYPRDMGDEGKETPRQPIRYTNPVRETTEPEGYLPWLGRSVFEPDYEHNLGRIPASIYSSEAYGPSSAAENVGLATPTSGRGGGGGSPAEMGPPVPMGPPRLSAPAAPAAPSAPGAPVAGATPGGAGGSSASGGRGAPGLPTQKQISEAFKPQEEFYGKTAPALAEKLRFDRQAYMRDVVGDTQAETDRMVEHMNKMLPDHMKKAEDALSKLHGDVDEQEKRAPYQGMLKMAFALLGTHSSNFGQALGEAGGQGLEEYNKVNEKVQERKMRLQEADIHVAAARDAAARGNLAMAMQQQQAAQRTREAAAAAEREANAQEVGYKMQYMGAAAGLPEKQLQFMTEISKANAMWAQATKPPETIAAAKFFTDHPEYAKYGRDQHAVDQVVTEMGRWQSSYEMEKRAAMTALANGSMPPEVFDRMFSPRAQQILHDQRQASIMNEIFTSRKMLEAAGGNPNTPIIQGPQ